MTPRRVDKEAKRMQILEAAMQVFAKNGINDFKMIEIAQAANVGKGTLYEYFPSKDDLIIGCFTLFMTKFNDQVLMQLSGVIDPIEQIRRLIAASFRFCQSERIMFDTIFDFYAASIPKRDGKSLLIEFTPMYKEMIAWVSNIIEEGVSQGLFKPVDSRITASSILALLDGFFFQIALGVTDVNTPHLSEKISTVLLEGLLNKRDDN